MNSNNRNSMFPFRRGGGKKRGKPGGGGSGSGGGRRQGGQGGGRRIPGSAQELLGVLQPTTKSLAQVLAGHTRASGQLVHARNVLGQAERLVDERAIDRLPPAQREEFFEQVARLKLTLADAEREAEVEAETEVAAPVAPMSMDRLRALALSIATGGPAPGEAESSETSASEKATDATVETRSAEPAETGADDDATADEAAPSAESSDKPARPKRANTLRLKTLRHEPADEDGLRRPEPAR